MYIVSAIVHFFSVLLKYAFDIESSDINCNFLPCFARLGFFFFCWFLFFSFSLLCLLMFLRAMLILDLEFC